MTTIEGKQTQGIPRRPEETLSQGIRLSNVGHPYDSFNLLTQNQLSRELQLIPTLLTIRSMVVDLQLGCAYALVNNR